MIATATHVAAISAGWKWIAVLIGFGFLGLLYIFIAVSAKPKSWNPWKLVEGADGRPSTSKLQWFLWLVAVLWAYVVLWVIRAHGGDYSAISTIPTNLLTVLGFSTGTAAAAKGITYAYTTNNKVVKSPASTTSPASPGASGSTNGSSPATGGVLTDDGGAPELAKIQMVGFTFVAIGIFLATVIHQISSSPPTVELPNIDSSLMVLMGISQGGYLGKKLVTLGAPILSAPSPTQVAASTSSAGSSVTVTGANLGQSQLGSVLLLNGKQFTPTSWASTSIVFEVPTTNPAGNTPWPASSQLSISVIVGGQQSNTVTVEVTS
jgi:IPT/TIG domain-containing protein